MIQYFVVLLISLAAALALTPLARSFGRKVGAVDRSDGFRKKHELPVPRVGGIAIFGAFLLAVFGGAFVLGFDKLRAYVGSAGFWTLTAIAAAILLIGILDDLFGVKARWKFIAQLAVALAMYIFGSRISAVTIPFRDTVQLGWFSLPLTIFWFIACMNAINLIDGLDGLASGVAVFAVGAVFAAGLIFGNVQAAFLCAALLGALLGFLFFNFHPASIFLGDSGSYLIGFLIAAISLEATQKSRMVFALLIPIIALGIPVIDTALAMLRRWAQSLPIFSADRQHLHHKLQDMGLSHRNTVLVIYAGCLVLAVLSLATIAIKDMTAAVIFFVICAVSVISVRAVGVKELSLAAARISRDLESRRRCAQYRIAVYEAVERMKSAESVESLWEIFSGAAGVMSLYDAALNIENARARDGEDDGATNLEWRSNGAHPAPATSIRWSSSFPLRSGNERFGELNVTKAFQEDRLGGEAALINILQPLCAAIAENVIRLRNESKLLCPADEPPLDNRLPLGEGMVREAPKASRPQQPLQ